MYLVIDYYPAIFEQLLFDLSEWLSQTEKPPPLIAQESARLGERGPVDTEATQGGGPWPVAVPD